ncbi:conserved hypothetical protein [Beutenbergia cavernae DSM 12333]|uniref:Adenylyltransferase AadA C-terminal domain-containing protein n=1 Tax=Beutenbergia cavernae (strain ATCC BAA-8 / DSM 12333 / CCUG 43141 / JCM 11478 / NBRC 16432 / NCIMB 13614 / HKI 0122) TaxID=471853 RepID=C5BX42_BEUC1|nr:aminoglycoside adenylyltransferase domain-containing protein [Beutenbergia cavernae]ACQ78717.1 conserved hypothetical protein [Beutenbergia cavernae DSM 12333]
MTSAALTPHPPDRAQSWATADPDIRSYVSAAVGLFTDELGDGVAGVVLHGSLAAGCFYRAKADLDLLVVVADPIEPTSRARLSRGLAQLAGTRPILGDLEVSAITAAAAATFRHPSPYELHYSAAWRDAVLEGRVDVAAQQVDGDLAGHVVVSRARGVALLGPPPVELFGAVPLEAFRDSVGADLAWTLSDDHLLESPYYGVLNVARTLRADAVGIERAVAEGTSKEEGALWALANLPEPRRGVVAQALACYRSGRPVSEAERPTDGHDWDPAALRAFRDDARDALAGWVSP